jgi:dCTP deaminase
LTVLTDRQLKAILAQFDRIFAPYPAIAYQLPARTVVKALVEKLTLGRPPILDRVDSSGVSTQDEVPIQHCLYAGWCEWFGRNDLRQEKIKEHPRLKELTFFEINRLCEMALLQQQAINRATAWRNKKGRDEPNGDSMVAPAAASAPASGALGRSILVDRLRKGDLYVGPLLSSDQVGASSIDLRMGNVVLVVRARGSSHVDPASFKRDMEAADHAKEIRLQQRLERYELKFETPFLLHPGTLALVPTLEWMSVPANLMGNVTARSTWAREGLSIATATMIEPGYQGIVTLELANLGEIPIALYPGLELAQITFLDVVGTTDRPKRGQFELSFEPRQGTVAKESEYCFLPTYPTS